MSKKEIFPGIHTVSSLLRWHPERVQSLWVEQHKNNRRIDQLMELASQAGISIQYVQRNKLDHMCESTQHQGLAATCGPTPLVDEHDLLNDLVNTSAPPLYLILDEVSDPHNLGACLRTADAAGVDAVILPQRHTAPLTPTVHKTASGATVRLKIVRTANLARCLDTIKKAGIWVYGAEGASSHSVYQADFIHPTAIVMGAEGQGMRRLTRDKCDQLLALPMLGGVESLNVSVATGIFLFEAVRQRQSSDSAN